MITRLAVVQIPTIDRSLWVLGELVTRKVSSEQTGRAYSLFEATVQPQGGPPPHIQHQEDEFFCVLEGQFEEIGEEAVDKSTPPVMEGPPDVGRIVAIAARYGIEIPPPRPERLPWRRQATRSSTARTPPPSSPARPTRRGKNSTAMEGAGS
jgi:hypothetical protein